MSHELDAAAPPTREQLIPGVKLWARDASGNWLDMVAMSALEPAGRTETSRHDFAGAYVCREGSEAPGVFWPLEDLRLRRVA